MTERARRQTEIARLLRERGHSADLPALTVPDPVAFSAVAGIAPDPWQARLLRSAAPRILLNASRQSGKSTTVATLAVWTALYRPDSLVLLLSPGLRQSSELFKKALGVYRASGRRVAAEAESALQLALGNGSRIVSLPGTEQTIRGYSGVRLLAVDEASRVPDELYYAVRPMLAVSGGRLVAMSTPFGKRGWWYEAWAAATADPPSQEWDVYRIPAEDCPRIAPAFLAEERASLPALWYASEYGCEFVDAIDQLFGYDLIAAALTDADEAAPLALDWSL